MEGERRSLRIHELRDEVAAFVRNANKEGKYKGYVNLNWLAKGRESRIEFPPKRTILWSKCLI